MITVSRALFLLRARAFIKHATMFLFAICPDVRRYDGPHLFSCARVRFLDVSSAYTYPYDTFTFYVIGPPGCAVKANVQKIWRQHFVIEESMLEVECPSVTLGTVLKASGHVDRFTDLMVKDVKTDECFRADHLLEDRLEELIADPAIKKEEKAEFEMLLARLDELKEDEMKEALKRCGCVSPETKNELSDPYPFNLMFPTNDWAEWEHSGFLEARNCARDVC